jgi:uncharacterized repeat protein (TIGR02543 family)
MRKVSLFAGIFGAVIVIGALFTGCEELAVLLQDDLASRSRTLVLVGADIGSSYTAEVFDYHASLAPKEYEVWEGLLAAVRTVGGGLAGAPSGTVSISLRSYAGSGGFTAGPYLVRVTARFGTAETARYKANISFVPDNILLDWNSMAETPAPVTAASGSEHSEYADAVKAAEVAKVLAAAAATMAEPTVSEPPEEAVVRHAVRFDTRGGSAVPSQSVESGGKARKPAVSPTRDGYVFAGWFTDSTIKALYRFDNPITADRTLYAGWIALFTVNFDTRGGSFVPSQTVERGSTAAIPAAPAKAGAAFAGWYADSGLSSRYNFDKIINGGITLYAKWIASSN